MWLLHIGQVNNRLKKKGARFSAPPSPLTSSKVETVLRQSLILDWKLEVPGEDRSSFVRTTKSEMLICSGMFVSENGSDNHRREKWAKLSHAHVIPICRKTKKQFIPPSGARKQLKKSLYSSECRSLNASLSWIVCLKSDLSVFDRV